MLTQPKFWDASEETQLTALMEVETRAEASYNDSESAMAELLRYTEENRGEGVSYRDTTVSTTPRGSRCGGR